MRAPPRTRGSARAPRLVRAAHAGSPRTRGSARGRTCPQYRGTGSPAHAGIGRLDEQENHPGKGSPAHAGIGPGWNQAANAPLRLPRARGDRPEGALVKAPGFEAPPRTRGSAPTSSSTRRSVAGSPAHAGIGRPPSSSARASRWLPRARGDRPFKETTHDRRQGAPPRTRGSAFSCIPGTPACAGSPAHAGIGPRSGRSSTCPCRLPRARGDRPRGLAAVTADEEAPPRTRGSALSWMTRAPELTGSPAHAGIGPSDEGRAGAGVGLPRARGDRPVEGATYVVVDAAPPRTRGSVQPYQFHRGADGGSPAHAGIGPLPPTVDRRDHGLPRARGDRPGGELVSVFSPEAPPRTRGSAFVGSAGGVSAGGSPAHAGIGPYRACRSRSLARLPRARGDRPALVSSATATDAAPPRTRGSACAG